MSARIDQNRAIKFTTQTKTFAQTGWFNEPFTQAIIRNSSTNAINYIDASGKMQLPPGAYYNIRMNQGEYNVSEIQIIIPIPAPGNEVTIVYTKYEGFNDQYVP
jgi:hypothetical protein